MESSSDRVETESGGKVQQGRSTSGVRNFFAGGFGGVCGVTIGHPFDTIKVRIQTTPSPKPGHEAVFKGTLDCLLKTLRNEGVRGLFKGLFTPVAFATPLNAIQFWAVSMARKMQMEDPHGIPTNFQNFTSGMFGGFCAAAIVAPADRIKCLLQIQQSSGGERKYKGALNCAKQLYKEKGMRSLYRGTFATLLRDVPSIGVYFCSYEWILNKLTLEGESRENLNPLRIFIAGGLTGMICWASIIPVDVLKSRYQTAPEGTYPRGIRDAFRQLVKEEGVASLFKGVTPVLLRAFPANAAFSFPLIGRFDYYGFGITTLNRIGLYVIEGGQFKGLFLGYEVAMNTFSWILPE